MDAIAARTLAVCWSLFQLYTAATGMFDLLIQLPIHVAFAVAVGFLTPVGGGRTGWRDGACAIAALGCGAYYVTQYPRLVTRMALVDAPLRADLAVGVRLPGGAPRGDGRRVDAGPVVRRPRAGPAPPLLGDARRPGAPSQARLGGR